ncbi:hypothetical protein [Mycoplasma sp. (ex Biomphalaria glabrata)]|nr:hypothetical protein [Mycoplasma sp. (ex Biomphalaria glabrata)]
MPKKYFSNEISDTLEQHLGVYIFRLREKIGSNSIILIRNKGILLNYE